MPDQGEINSNWRLTQVTGIGYIQQGKSANQARIEEESTTGKQCIGSIERPKCFQTHAKNGSKLGSQLDRSSEDNGVTLNVSRRTDKLHNVAGE